MAPNDRNWDLLGFRSYFSRFILFKNSSHRKSYKIFDKYAVEKWSWKSSVEVGKYWSKLESFIEVWMHFQTKLMLCKFIFDFPTNNFFNSQYFQLRFPTSYEPSSPHSIWPGQSMFGTAVTLAAKVWHQAVNFGTKFNWNVNFNHGKVLWKSIVPKWMTCAEVYIWYRSSCAEVHPYRSSFSRFSPQLAF